MGITIGTEARANVPIYLKFIYGGAEAAWGQPYKINGLSNSGESIDGDYRISDIDVYFVDRYAAMFTNVFGNGTVGFGSSLQVIAYLGGTMEYQTSGLNTSWLRLGTAGAHVATVHTGKLYAISYKDRLLRLRSKSRMAHLGDLKWQYPVNDMGFAMTIYGSNAFYNGGNLCAGRLGTEAFYEVEDVKSKWKCSAYPLATSFGPNGYLSVNGFPAMAGRGTGTLPTPDESMTWFYPGTNSGGTNFYDTFEPINFTGSYLGTYHGTFTEDSHAQEFGFVNVAAANDSALSSGTYFVNKSRFRANDAITGSRFHFMRPILIEGTPKDMFRDIMTGAMVSPLFNSSDLDTTTLNESGTNTAFFGMRRKVWFREKGVLETLKDLFNCTQALFSVNTNDKFEFRTYGPKNLNTSLPALGTNDIISSEFNNYEDDYYNRFVFRYMWDGLDNSFGSVYEEKAVNWGIGYDRPLVIESPFTYNPNEAAVMTQRIKAKYSKTFPHINFRTNLNHLGVDIGSLYQITDPNSGMSSKVVQVTGYKKDWEGKVIDFEGYDGEALYQRRGYAQWDDGTLSVLPGGTITGTSTAGWGTTDWQGINTTIYGTSFVWW